MHMLRSSTGPLPPNALAQATHMHNGQLHVRSYGHLAMSSFFHHHTKRTIHLHDPRPSSLPPVQARYFFPTQQTSLAVMICPAAGWTTAFNLCWVCTMAGCIWRRAIGRPFGAMVWVGHEWLVITTCTHTKYCIRHSMTNVQQCLPFPQKSIIPTPQVVGPVTNTTSTSPTPRVGHLYPGRENSKQA